MARLNRDLHVSAEFITFLKAGFYGQVLFESALARLEPSVSPLPSSYLETAHKAFDKIDRWTKDLAEELPLFALNWKTIETFDAISAMSFLREFKRECLWIMPQIDSALSATNLAQNRDAVKLLAASLVRSAATRVCYVETLSQCFADLKAKDYSERVALEIDGAREYLSITNSIVDVFSGGGVYSNELCDKLRKEASLVPSDIRSYVHDANILLNLLVKEFTFELAEISKAEAQEWIAAQLPAAVAGYWRAYGFGPRDYFEWAQIGVTGAPLAANWRRARFMPQEAGPWIREGIAPVIAILWKSHGFDAPRTAALLRRGETDPTKASRYDKEESEDYVSLEGDEDGNSGSGGDQGGSGGQPG